MPESLSGGGKMKRILTVLHKKSWAVIDRPYSLACATVGALYERPRCIFCAKPTRPITSCSVPATSHGHTVILNNPLRYSLRYTFVTLCKIFVRFGNQALTKNHHCS